MRCSQGCTRAQACACWGLMKVYWTSYSPLKPLTVCTDIFIFILCTYTSSFATQLLLQKTHCMRLSPSAITLIWFRLLSGNAFLKDFMSRSFHVNLKWASFDWHLWTFVVCTAGTVVRTTNTHKHLGKGNTGADFIQSELNCATFWFRLISAQFHNPQVMRSLLKSCEVNLAAGVM